MHFKNLEGKPERESSKRTISTSVRLRLLKKILESDVPVRTKSPKGGWIVRSQIGWRREQNILDKGVETSR